MAGWGGSSNKKGLSELSPGDSVEGLRDLSMPAVACCSAEACCPAEVEVDCSPAWQYPASSLNSEQWCPV
jgi:tartrate dehydratase alpha subunit/fumarate hydratase class I-like protein